MVLVQQNRVSRPAFGWLRLAFGVGDEATLAIARPLKGLFRLLGHGCSPRVMPPRDPPGSVDRMVSSLTQRTDHRKQAIGRCTAPHGAAGRVHEHPGHWQAGRGGRTDRWAAWTGILRRDGGWINPTDHRTADIGATETGRGVALEAWVGSELSAGGGYASYAILEALCGRGARSVSGGRVVNATTRFRRQSRPP